MPEAEVKTGAKRSTYYGEFDEQVSPQKQTRSENVEVRLLFLERSCGSIIGKGGENITRLRSQYNVNLKMHSSRTIDRVCSIDGEIDNCMGVIKELLQHSAQGPYSTNMKCSIEINLLVQTDSVGSILGKGGARIKEIREESNAKIKVYQECLPNSNERIIAIGGDDENQVLSALTAILNIFKSLTNRSAAIHYNPENKPGEINVGSVVGPPITNNQGRWGNEGAGDGFMGAGYSMNNQMGAGNVPQTMGNSNVNNPGNSSSFLQLQTVTNITTPNDMCGAIIGKGGLRIREIRDNSGARITFSESEKESKEDRVITITGTQQQVQVAEQLITQYTHNLTT